MIAVREAIPRHDADGRSAGQREHQRHQPISPRRFPSRFCHRVPVCCSRRRSVSLPFDARRILIAQSSPRTSGLVCKTREFSIGARITDVCSLTNRPRRNRTALEHKRHRYWIQRNISRQQRRWAISLRFSDAGHIDGVAGRAFQWRTGTDRFDDYSAGIASCAAGSWRDDPGLIR